MRIQRFTLTGPQLLFAALGVAVLAVLFQNTFSLLYATWQLDEYSHGFLIPAITAWLIWQRRRQLASVPWRGSWIGAALVLFGLVVFFLGSLAAITTIDAYAFVIVIGGFALAIMGWPAFRLILVPIGLLLLMNPLPQFLYANLSSQLQLLSSQIGVAVIRLFGVSVYLEGNVIDLGTYQLQVAEACSGLRYLFPLMSVGAIMGYLLRGKTWVRWVVFLSTMPLTILMNSFRIGVIGVLVDRFGVEQAQGFLHVFEGWVVFMLCLAILSLEAWALVRLSGEQRRFRDLFVPEQEAGPTEPAAPLRRWSAPATACLALLMLAVYPTFAIPQRVEVPPQRAPFVSFPMQIGQWQGRREAIEKLYLDVLRLDDYVLANYSQAGQPGVNLYAAYYASQRTGQSVHSPASCLPGGGWRIQSMRRSNLPGVSSGRGGELAVNRVVIQQGNTRQLVYYWFQQRGRDITNEYQVKWYLFWDSLTRNRSDGALVRVITPLSEGEPESAAEARLAAFTAQAVARLARFVPD